MKVRVGVVGVGHRARSFLPALAKMEDVKLLALADLDGLRLQTAANEYKVDHTFALLSEMLDAVRLDAVVILTPDPSHHPQTIAALDWGVLFAAFPLMNCPS